MENVVLLRAFDLVARTPFNQVHAFEFEFILDIVLVGWTPMPRFRKPAAGF
jgi:hypothetical protein